MKILQINLGMPKDISALHPGLFSGILKEKVDSCYLEKEHIVGDGVGRPEFHGGPDRVVCMYPFEHYDRWEKQFNISLPHPAFGENFILTGMTEEQVYIGDIYRIGEAVVQVTQGRIPCQTIDQRNQLNGILAEFVRTGLSGYFCRVLEVGRVHCNSPITLIEREPTSISVLQANQIMFNKNASLTDVERLLKIKGLADAWRKKLAERISSGT
ncbi:MOSC domain-containing protein [Ammoniphilus sp. YIM 78166]|uniref:MOSC domain-containing protein n=1 Tax=Ammoniphilus sp. YIM 78166 TaxID=1644106 RepID=UPI00106FCFE7|nr:MOSC domain-containing protein [Ammoniphilus sp. YIM 78166]